MTELQQHFVDCCFFAVVGLIFGGILWRPEAKRFDHLRNNPERISGIVANAWTMVRAFEPTKPRTFVIFFARAVDQDRREIASAD